MPETSAAHAGQDGWIACLTYKSLATAPPSEPELRTLVSKARTRNRMLNVTGMLIYEGGAFLQTLEGPKDKLDTLWTSIKQDRRHEHIEVLTEHIAPARLFSDWDLLLHSRNDNAAHGPKTTSATPPAIGAHIKKLRELALNADDVRINAFFASLQDEGWTSDAVVTLLIEPTARALGDAWLADECSEFDLTIGLSMMQLAGHAVRRHTSSSAIRNTQYKILLAVAPGEQHMLGTSILADQMTDAGWRVDMAFPDSDEALFNQLRAEHPDVVDIGLSDAMARPQALPRLRTTIDHSRHAASDHPTVISVGGRLFAEAAATAASVGADHARLTAAGASIRMAELVGMSRAGKTASRQPSG